MLSYKWGVFDLSGRLWARTLTSIKAAKLVEKMLAERGLVCSIKAL